MNHMDQTTAGTTADQSRRNRSKLAILTAAALAICGSGCSSKPGKSDIEQSLINEFQCPILEIKHVRKTDGIERGDHSYEVSYTFEVGLNGGGGAAAKLLPELNMLGERLERGRLQHDRASQAAAISDNPTPLEAAANRAAAEVFAVKKRLAELQPCQAVNARFAVERMRAAAQPKEGSSEQGIPVGLIMRGASAMIKAESGWRFAEPPRFDINAEKVSRDSKVQMPPQPAPLWTEFSQAEGAFIANVPSPEQCNFAETDSKTGMHWWQCSFGTANTNMDIWFAKLAKPSVISAADLEAKARDIAEQHNEQISDIKPIKWGDLDAAEFTANSAEGARKVRLFMAGKYEVQAIASPVPGRTVNLAEMQKFIEGVKPASIAD